MIIATMIKNTQRKTYIKILKVLVLKPLLLVLKPLITAIRSADDGYHALLRCKLPHNILEWQSDLNLLASFVHRYQIGSRNIQPYFTKQNSA